MLLVLSRRTLALAAAGALLLLLGVGANLVRAGGGGPATVSGTAVIWRVPTDAREVALTFDDGPDPEYTPRVLELLSSYHATGTFFVLGSQVALYPGLAVREALQGSEVCNHGYSHKMLRGRSAAFVEADVVRTQRLLDALDIPRCPLFRFPYFASDAVSRTTVAKLGYRIVAAAVDTRDWQGASAQTIARRALAHLQPGDIVLFHDAGGPRARTVRALALVLQGLRERGLRAVTVDQLLATVPQGRPPAPQEE